MMNNIVCSVENCKYNGTAKKCNLDSVNVGATKNEPEAKKDTQCGSFECC